MKFGHYTILSLKVLPRSTSAFNNLFKQKNMLRINFKTPEKTICFNLSFILY